MYVYCIYLKPNSTHIFISKWPNDEARHISEQDSDLTEGLQAKSYEVQS